MSQPTPVPIWMRVVTSWLTVLLVFVVVAALSSVIALSLDWPKLPDPDLEIPGR